MDSTTKFNKDFERVKELNNKYIDLRVLFIFIDEIKYYDSQFYYRLKNQFISYWLNYTTSELVLIKDLNLNFDDSLLFIKWMDYCNIESININKIYE